MSDDTTNPTDAVGYKSPPQDTRFKPGRSGNPKGRPKKPKARSFLNDAAAAFASRIRIIQNGKTIRLSRVEIAAKTLVNKALKKDPYALRLLLKYLVAWEKEARKGKDQKIEIKWADWKWINGKWKAVVEEKK